MKYRLALISSVHPASRTNSVISHLILILLLAFGVVFVPAKAQNTEEFTGPINRKVVCHGKTWDFSLYQAANGQDLMLRADDPQLQALARTLGRHLTWSPESTTLSSDLGRSLVLGKTDNLPSRKEGPPIVPPTVINGAVHVPILGLEAMLDCKVTPSGPGRPNIYLEPTLKSLTWVDDQAQGVILRAETSVPVRKKVFKLSGPPRTVVDLVGVALPEDFQELTHPVLGEIRVGQFELAPSVTRIVIPSPTGVKVSTPRSLDLFEHKMVLDWPASMANQGGASQSKPATLPTPAPPVSNKPTAEIVQTIPIPSSNSSGTQNPQATPPPQVGPANRPPAASVGPKRTTLQQARWEGNRLRLTFSEPVTYQWSRLGDGKHRYVIDFPGVIFPDKKQTLSASLPAVEAVRIVQNMPEPNPVVRVVCDLKTPLYVVPSAPSEQELVLEFPGRNLAAGEARKGSGRTQKVQPGSVRGRVICIDPGHGGSDPGAINRSVNLTEKQATLDISLRLAKQLEARGWTVVLTRNVDRDVSWAGSSATQELGARARVANNAGADVFLSIHCDAAANPAAEGTSLHWYKAADLRLAQALEGDILRATGRKNRGLLKNRFYVLAHTTMPAVLIETAFLTNPTEGRLLADPNYRQRIAEGIADGLDVYAAHNFVNRLSSTP